MDPGYGICLFYLAKVQGKDSLNCLWPCTWLNEVLVDDAALAENFVLLDHSALKELAWRLEPMEAEVDSVYSVDISISTAEAVWRLDFGLGGKLEVIGDLRLVARF